MATTEITTDQQSSIQAQADPQAWDSFALSLGASPFQAWAWGELKGRFGWQPHRLSTTDGTSGAQVLVRPFRGLSVAYVPRGPFPQADGPLNQRLLDETVRLARSRRAAFLRYEPDILMTDERAADLDAFLKSNGFRTAERTLGQRSSVRLDLSPTEDELFAAFSKGHRADVKRGERSGVAVRVGTSEADVNRLHEMLIATTERKTFEYHTAAYYRTMWRLFGDAARLYLAEVDRDVVAASLVIAWGDTGLYLFAGSTRAGLDSRAGHVLQWHAIRWAKERGAKTWDLWGIADARGRLEMLRASGAAADSPEMVRLEAEAKRDPKDGLDRFKKGWGGYVVRNVPAYDRVFIPPAYWYWTRRRGEG
jgi:lipid II:glycine glycyltransferase (peptidoglycan interpeptide bridge formation enzyme)